MLASYSIVATCGTKLQNMSNPPLDPAKAEESLEQLKNSSPVGLPNIKYDRTQKSALGCLPGFAGYEILVLGKHIRSDSYYDLDFLIHTNRDLSDTELSMLERLIYNLNSPEMVDWLDSGIFCRYSVVANAGSYGWDGETKQIPAAVNDLIAALQALCSPL